MAWHYRCLSAGFCRVELQRGKGKIDNSGVDSRAWSKPYVARNRTWTTHRLPGAFFSRRFGAALVYDPRNTSSTVWSSGRNSPVVRGTKIQEKSERGLQIYVSIYSAFYVRLRRLYKMRARNLIRGQESAPRSYYFPTLSRSAETPDAAGRLISATRARMQIFSRRVAGELSNLWLSLCPRRSVAGRAPLANCRDSSLASLCSCFPAASGGAR